MGPGGSSCCRPETSTLDAKGRRLTSDRQPEHARRYPEIRRIARTIGTAATMTRARGCDPAGNKPKATASRRGADTANLPHCRSFAFSQEVPEERSMRPLGAKLVPGEGTRTPLTRRYQDAPSGLRFTASGNNARQASVQIRHARRSTATASGPDHRPSPPSPWPYRPHVSWQTRR